MGKILQATKRRVVALRLADPLVGLSTMADLGFSLPAGESLRACALGTALARRLDLSEADVHAVYYTALLQHLGCTGFAHETAAVFGDEMAMNTAASRTNFASTRDVFATFLPELTRGHGAAGRIRLTVAAMTSGSRFGDQFAAAVCEVGSATARRLGLPKEVQRALFHVQEWWNGKGAPARLAGDDIPLAARLAALADIACLFDGIGGPDLATSAVTSRAGGILDPHLADQFAREATALLDELNAADARELVLAAEPTPHAMISDGHLLEAAAAFGDLADLKTPYTHGHSDGVATLAEAAGRSLGLSGPDVRQLRLAALLHDLGRVAISNAVWEQPRSLRSDEWEQVRLHPYYSERILTGSEALRPVARWAGMHHERLDGSGYHRGCGPGDLPMPVRILAAADAFHGMTQLRPHRAALPSERAAAKVREQAGVGRLDPDAVEAVLSAAGEKRPRVRRTWPAGLSDREVEVLALVAQGCANKEIARRLVISRRTAEHHVQHIYTKIGVSSRAAAALFAMEHHLLSDHAPR
jgi:HD-GYP domain-containing protein (c-di-GMP phosphodiesterase class II)